MPKSNLAKIAEKVENGKRLSKSDAIRLMESDDILSLGDLSGRLASWIPRSAGVGRRTHT